MSKRPLRNIQEKVTSKVPKGPLGFVGDGNALGASTFFVVNTVNRLTPISGVRMGYKIISHNVNRTPSVNTYTYQINAYSKDVARFVAKQSAAPSTVDLFRKDITVTSIEPVQERKTATTWKVVVTVKDRQMPGNK